MSNDLVNNPIVKENIVAFIDSTGRAGFGERIPSLDTDSTYAIKNPVVVHVVQQQSNMALQLLPAFFKEFLAERDGAIVFSFPKSSVALSVNTIFDFKLYGQYESMFNPAPPAPPQQPAENKVIKLFDESK